MGEYKRKFGIYAAWNYELEIEDLNRMSEQGWQLIEGGCFSNRFKKNSEVQYRYQLDFQPNIEEKGRYIETFQEQGWEYVNNTFNGWYYFRKLYDPSQPEEQYEIFTDISSRREMNNRWVIIGMIFVLIWMYAFAKQAFSMISCPNFLTLFRMLYVGFILAIFVRGIVIMKNQKKPKNAKLDKALIKVFFIGIVAGAIIGTKLIESSRPIFSYSNISSEKSPISDDLEDATKWMEFEVKYEDNYYMDVEVDADASLCISIVDEMGEKIYTLTAAEYEEDNIRLHLQKGVYFIYFSDFAGGSLNVSVSMR